MDAKSEQETLLAKKQNDTEYYAKKRHFLLVMIKWVLKAAMWAIFVAWAATIFLFPSDSVNDLYYKWLRASEGTIFGETGSVFVVFSAPILVIAFLATAYIFLRGEDEIHGKGAGSRSYPRFRLWTFPILVDGPFGVVSAAEIIGIVLFATYIIWAIYAETLKNIKFMSFFHIPSSHQSVFMLEITGLRLGLIGLFCLAFLFLPVARGSILLRLIDIPFEHATRYHVWLGHLTMTLFTLHGLFYVIGWTIEGRLVEELTSWKNIGIANFPGVISLGAGLVMWVTSLPGVRRLNFELFFYTHQLYVVFIVFMALHIGDFLFCYAAGGIFLFMLDRFLRFCQSRRTVDVVSARRFPCGTLELVISKPANLRYNALGWIFLQVRELSWLQWHPFSVSSSPLDGKHHLAILVKVLGDWTHKLETYMSESEDKQQLLQPYHSNKITASVEGPYGHESSYHLTYENLILVAGGIGISPFIAILSDVVHRMNDGKPCLPKNILIIWAIKTTDELPLLQTLGLHSLTHMLDLEIQTYVTRQSEPSLEEGETDIEPIDSSVFTSGYGISTLVGTGNIIWSGIYIIAATAGLVLTLAMLDIMYINPYNINHWWYKGLLLVVSMAVSVVVFGGLVIGLWHLWEIKTEHEHETANSPKYKTHKNSVKEQLKNITTIRYGKRPDFRGIFGSMSDKWGNVDIGVIVCGPPSLQTSVAKECRTQNFSRQTNHPIFHFNTHSFDL